MFQRLITKHITKWVNNMAEVKSLFREYISTIEPDTSAKRLAAEAHILPREYLEEDESFGEHIVGSFLYGSYRRQTAIHEIKDVDIMILTDFDVSLTSPSKVLDDLYDALRRCYGDDKVLKKNRRSIQVLDPLPDKDTDLTLDILPAVETPDGSGYLLVPDKDKKQWVKTNPRGHIEKISETNIEQDSKLVPMIKIMKAWWAYQSQDLTGDDGEKPRPKSFWIETLVLNYFDNTGESWAEKFLRFIEQISNLSPSAWPIPYLEDPGMPGVQLKTSMDDDEYSDFMNKIRETEYIANKALSEPNRSVSSKLWASVFGDDFPIEEADPQQTAGKQYLLGDSSHAKELNLPISQFGKVRIYADLYRKNYDNKKLKVRLGNLVNDGTVKSGLFIQFRAKPDFALPEKYDVYWRVVNTGRHAQKNMGLRGSPFTDHSGSELTRWEPTEYTGKHWIDCYIVSNGKIVGRSGKFYVNITNTKWIG